MYVVFIHEGADTTP